MLQSQLFSKTKKRPSKEAVTISHKLLDQAGFIDQLASGIWSFLPLGRRVHQKIENIIREEINAIGGQEVFLPTLQPKSLWQETDRWDKIDPPLFRTKDRHDREYGLGSTHEEVITDLARKNIKSYKDLPLAIYQIQTKFRNEMRATSGLLRTREFSMKDLYSFHQNEEDLEKYYQKVCLAYQKIYQKCELKAIKVEASSGTIGGDVSHEFMILAATGEDKILICQKCSWAANIEIGKQKTCPKCKSKLRQESCIEAGHIFNLGIKYSGAMKANFVDKNGQEKPLVMGCYGIGLGRLMATIVEAHHDKNGIIWPASVSPFDAHLISINSQQSTVNNKIKENTENLYKILQKKEIDILYDDRDESPGVKLKDADLIGIPVRLVISEKTGDRVEVKKRDSDKVELVKIDKIKKILISN
jgi:prolyl-tRNA synthetase